MYKVLFINKNFIVRLGLHHILLEHLHIDIRFQALADGTESQEWLAKNQCNLVIVGSIRTDTIQLVKQIKAQDSKIRILVFADMKYTDAINLLMTGVDGFIYQRTEIKEVVLAVQTVMSGASYRGRKLTEEMAEETLLGRMQVKKNILSNKIERTRHKLLSKRQMDVVRALIRGESVPVIAVNLSLSPSTVATHKSIAFKKLGVNSLLQLIESYYADTNYLGSQDL